MVRRFNCFFDHRTFPRGHNAFTGKTAPTPECRTPDVDANLDIITLVNDCVSLLTTIFPDPAASPSLLVSLPPFLTCSRWYVLIFSAVDRTQFGWICLRSDSSLAS